MMNKTDHIACAAVAVEREIDVAVRDIVAKAFEQATAILRTRRTDLRRRRPPAACAGDVDRRSIPRDPARDEAT